MRFLLLILLSGISQAFNPGLKAQHIQIPNGGFEDWVFTGAYYEPFYWQTLNILLEFGCTDFVFPDSTASEGKLCARIETLECYDAGQGFRDTFPGLIVVGEPDLAPGIPANTRPGSLKFSCKYRPIPGDTALVLAMFLKKAPGIGSRLVGIALYEVGDTLYDWTDLDIPVVWITPESPDTLKIIVSSSKSIIQNRKPSPGSIFWIDNLRTDIPILDPTLGLASTTDLGFTAYPNPVTAGTRFHFRSTHSKEPVKLQIYSADGRCIRSLETNDHGIIPQQLGLYSGAYRLVWREVNSGKAGSTGLLVLE